MVGYLIGDLVGSPYRDFNVFDVDANTPLLSPHTFYFGRLRDGMRDVVFSSYVREVEPSDAFMVSAAVSRFLFDTQNDRGRRVQVRELQEDLEYFSQDYGRDFPYDERFLPAAVSVMAHAAANKRELDGMVNAMCELMGVGPVSDASIQDGTASEQAMAARAFSDVLWELDHGTPLEDISDMLDRSYPMVDTWVPEEALRQVANSAGFLYQDIFLGPVMPEFEVNRSLLHSVRCGIKAALEGVSFDDSLRRAVSLGGDSQVVVAVAGALAEQRFRGIDGDRRFAELEGAAEAFIPLEYSKTLALLEEKFVGGLRRGNWDLKALSEQKPGEDFSREMLAADLEFSRSHYSQSIELDPFAGLVYSSLDELEFRNNRSGFSVDDVRGVARSIGVRPDVRSLDASLVEFFKFHAKDGLVGREDAAFLIGILCRPRHLQEFMNVGKSVRDPLPFPHVSVLRYSNGTRRYYITDFQKESVEEAAERLGIVGTPEKEVHFTEEQKSRVMELVEQNRSDELFVVLHGRDVQVNDGNLETIASYFGIVPEVTYTGKVGFSASDLARIEDDAKERRKPYDEFVSRMKAAFGEKNVVIGGDPKADWKAAYQAWDRPGVTYVAPDPPELLDRFFVKDYVAQVRTPDNQLKKVKKDVVLPMGQLKKVYFSSDDVTGLIQWKAWKDNGAGKDALKVAKEKLAKARTDLSDMRASGASRKSLSDQMAVVHQLDRNRVILEKGRDGFGPFVLESYKEYGNSAEASRVARELYNTTDGRSKDNPSYRDSDECKALWKDYFRAHEASLCLEAVEQRIPFMVSRAAESQHIISSLRQEVSHIYYDLFGVGANLKPAQFDRLAGKEKGLLDIFKHLHVGSYEYEGVITKACSVEFGVDYLAVRNGDDIVGSIEVNPVNGGIRLNARREEGVVESCGMLSPVAKQQDLSRQMKLSGWAPEDFPSLESKVSDYTRQFENILTNSKSFEEIKDEREKMEDAIGRASPYDTMMANNVEKLMYVLSTSYDPAVNYAFNRLDTERFTADQCLDRYIGEQLEMAAVFLKDDRDLEAFADLSVKPGSKWLDVDSSKVVKALAEYDIPENVLLKPSVREAIENEQKKVSVGLKR